MTTSIEYGSKYDVMLDANIETFERELERLLGQTGAAISQTMNDRYFLTTTDALVRNNDLLMRLLTLQTAIIGHQAKPDHHITLALGDAVKFLPQLNKDEYLTGLHAMSEILTRRQALPFFVQCFIHYALGEGNDTVGLKEVTEDWKTLAKELRDPINNNLPDTQDVKIDGKRRRGWENVAYDRDKAGDMVRRLHAINEAAVSHYREISGVPE